MCLGRWQNWSSNITKRTPLKSSFQYLGLSDWFSNQYYWWPSPTHSSTTSPSSPRTSATILSSVLNWTICLLFTAYYVYMLFSEPWWTELFTWTLDPTAFPKCTYVKPIITSPLNACSKTIRTNSSYLLSWSVFCCSASLWESVRGSWRCLARCNRSISPTRYGWPS